MRIKDSIDYRQIFDREYISKKAKKVLTTLIISASLAACGRNSDVVGVQDSPVNTPTPDWRASCEQVVVVSGDSWWRIAQNELGDGNKYVEALKEDNPEVLVGGLDPGEVVLVCDEGIGLENEGSVVVENIDLPTVEIPPTLEVPATIVPQQPETVVIEQNPQNSENHLHLAPPPPLAENVKKKIIDATVQIRIEVAEGPFVGEVYGCTGIHIGGGKIYFDAHCFLYKIVTNPETGRNEKIYLKNPDGSLQTRIKAGHVDYKFYQGSEVNYNEIDDIAVVQLADFDNGLGAVEVGNPNHLRFNDPLYLLNYQDGSNAIVDVVGRYMGRFGSDFIVATGIDGSPHSWFGGSGGGAIDSEGRLYGTAQGIWGDPERHNAIASDLGVDAENVGMFTSVTPITQLR